MSKQKTPTYKEFYAAVKAHFQHRWPQLEDDEVERYLNEDDYIKSEYEEYKEKYEAGEVTYRQFMEGHVATIAYQLEMEY